MMMFQLLCILIAVAFYTLLERKILGYLQYRKGPNKPSLMGILTPLGDAIKLFSKEINMPYSSNRMLFLFVPTLSLFLPCFLWGMFPSLCPVLLFKYSTLMFICVTSVGVYGLLGSGWSSNSKYAFLGAIRAVAQSISYEVCLSLLLIHSILFLTFTFFTGGPFTLCVFSFCSMFLLFVALLAETNRSPFDFSEGESELVSGFNTEFSATHFVMIFLGEYLSILFMSLVISFLYNMSCVSDGFLFTLLWATAFVWTRGTLPRLRYDQLMHLAWKCLLPMALAVACLLLEA